MKSFLATISLALVAGALGCAAVATPGEAHAQTTAQSASSDLPASLRKAAIAGYDSGTVAGARIPNTDTYVVYVKSPDLCGSGGCMAQIWALEGKKYIRKESLPVGFLPITVLPDMQNGMPWLGVSVNNKSLEPATLVVASDGKDYSLMDWDTLLPANEGKALITESMMRPFSAGGQASAPTGNQLKQNNAAAAQKLATANVSTQSAYVGNIGAVDAKKDPWTVVTQEYMLAHTDNPNYRPTQFNIAVEVDYDRDGVMDIARMYVNSKQSAVVVKYGASGRNEVIFKKDGLFGEGEQIFPAGKNRVALMIPDEGYVLMMQKDGQPAISVSSR